jgi:hypothetical protein
VLTVLVLVFSLLFFASILACSGVCALLCARSSRQLQESAGVLDACKQACAVLGSEAEDLKRAHAVSLACIPQTFYVTL